MGLVRLWWLIQQCETAVLASPGGPSFGCHCPWCTARGLSVVDDESGRFISCLVCGTTAPRTTGA
jgi:hypothetical protein